jgi:VWFA-related protein
MLLLSAMAILPSTARADIVNFRGKVVMEDGAPPGRLVTIQRSCQGTSGAIPEANASPKTGEYFVHLYFDPYGASLGGSLTWGLVSNDVLSCYLEAVVKGYVSTRVDLSDRHIAYNPQLPDIVLSRQAPGALVDINRAFTVPRAAKKPWELALTRLTARNWAGAEEALRSVVAAAPDFAPAWSALGAACQKQKKPAEARRALERAIELDPKRLPLYLALATVQIELNDWAAVARSSEALIKADTGHVYLEAYLDNAVARYQRQDYDGALERMNELIQLDKKRELPRAEYVLGIVLEARRELDAAAQHMRKYLDQHPGAKDAAAVRDRIANLGKQPRADLAAEAASAETWMAAAGEASVPGGIRAFAAIAQMPGEPTYQDFFLRYCRAILGSGPGQASPTREVSAAIRAFVSSVAELERLGERNGDRTLIRLAVETDDQRKKTEDALALLGWRLRRSGQTYDVEPGELPIDGLRQRIPGAFGIDELEMRDALAAGRPYQFEIPIENARLTGGVAWSAALKGGRDAALGPVDVFLRDWRFARLYAALGAMDAETAAAVVSAVGLVPLIVTYSELMAEFGEALSLAGDRVAVPGGVQAEPVWARLAGANPRNPPAFFRALLEKDRGLLMAFFFDLSRADAARQQFMTATPVRAEAFYKWYRDSAGQGPPAPAGSRWQAAILQELRLGANGSLEFPGGRRAWTAAAGTDEEVLLHLPSIEPLAALARLEEKRGRPLDQGSATLLAQHYREWRHLFPYFEKLPGLAEPEFRALAAFADAAAGALPAQQAVLMGDWHSLVELIVLGAQAGSLNAAQAAHAFGRVCQALRPANPSANAIETLREIGGGSADVDEALASGLLRLSGAKRGAFERVKEIQGVPRIASLGQTPDAAKTLAALSGAVYAALLDPGSLLVAEDPGLLAKHDFLPRPDKQAGLFADSGLVISNSPPGSKLIGGFGRFREVTLALDARTVEKEPPEEPEDSAPALLEAVGPGAAPHAPLDPLPPGPVFRANGRIVEVYATVTDSRGRYVDDLDRNDFSILVEGQPTQVSAFESRTSSVSVALLFDTTGSMTATLPSLKRAAMQLVDELRPSDSVAVYGFNDKVTEFQPFTTGKTAVKRAVLRAHPAGITALYDALVRVSRDLAQRRGKKVIIVFTDGDDNASMLTADAAIRRAKSRGIPIYTIAEGEALQHPHLVSRLADLSQATGGAPFLIQKLADIGDAFQRMSEDLMHGYLLALQPPPATGNAWQKIAVAVSNRKGLLIRAREGYYSE